MQTGLVSAGSGDSAVPVGAVPWRYHAAGSRADSALSGRAESAAPGREGWSLADEGQSLTDPRRMLGRFSQRDPKL